MENAQPKLKSLLDQLNTVMVGKAAQVQDCVVCLLAGTDRRDMLAGMLPILSPEDLLALQRQVQQVHAAEPLLNYLQDLIAATRSGRWFIQGLSPRAGIAVLRAARAQAFVSGRDYVAPDDIQAILPQTVAHRLVPVGDAGRGAFEQVRAMVDAIPLP